MAKGDDAVMRKKNKARRKKLNQKNSSNVSARDAAIIAAKKRRMSGKRRKCQGMCLSLPTLDDPFNDRQGKDEFQIKEAKKGKRLQVDKNASVKGKNVLSKKGTKIEDNAKADHLQQMNDKFIALKDQLEKLITSIDTVGKRGLLSQEEQIFSGMGRVVPMVIKEKPVKTWIVLQSILYCA